FHVTNPGNPADADNPSGYSVATCQAYGGNACRRAHILSRTGLVDQHWRPGHAPSPGHRQRRVHDADGVVVLCALLRSGQTLADSIADMGIALCADTLRHPGTGTAFSTDALGYHDRRQPAIGALRRPVRLCHGARVMDARARLAGPGKDRGADESGTAVHGHAGNHAARRDAASLPRGGRRPDPVRHCPGADESTTRRRPTAESSNRRADVQLEQLDGIAAADALAFILGQTQAMSQVAVIIGAAEVGPV